MMVGIQIVLTQDPSQALKTLAAIRAIPAEDLIQPAVELLIQSSGAAEGIERRRRAIAAAGRFQANALNLAADHDRYLAEALQA